MATETVKSMDLPLLDDFDTFEEYYECMQMWELETKVKPENRGPMVAMSIPVDSTKFGDKLRKSVFKTVKPSTLSGNINGCKAVLDFLKLSEVSQMYHILRGWGRGRCLKVILQTCEPKSFQS